MTYSHVSRRGSTSTEELQALFDRVCAIFAPNRTYSYRRLRQFFFKYQDCRRWYEETSGDDTPATRETAQHVAGCSKWQDPNQGKHDVKREVRPYLPQLLSSADTRQELHRFVQSQLAATEALFSFRDSFHGPQAVIYDPHRLLFSETVNVHDLLHLLRHYHFSPPLSRRHFQQEFGKIDLTGGFYFELRDSRDEKVSAELAYHSDEERERFEELWCHRPVGMSGLQLRVRQPGGDVIHRDVSPEIARALQDEALPALITASDAAGIAYRRLQGSSIWSRRLVVHFPEGNWDDAYRIFLGTSAFFAYAALKTHFWSRKRMKSEAIIL